MPTFPKVLTIDTEVLARDSRRFLVIREGVDGRALALVQVFDTSGAPDLTRREFAFELVHRWNNGSVPQRP